MLVLVIAGKSRSEYESAASFFLVSQAVVVSALEHFAHRICDFHWELAAPSSTLDHASHHPGDCGLVDVVFGACACCLQQARGILTAALTKPFRLMG